MSLVSMRQLLDHAADHSYGLPASDAVRSYVQRICLLPATQEWIQAALAEQDFLQFEEPYRQQR
mgnify:CR=1 FL=1